jgi:hypothetical protein
MCINQFLDMHNIYYPFDNITMGMIDAGSMYAEWLSTKFRIPPEQFNNVPQPPKKTKNSNFIYFLFLFQKEMWKSHENWNISPEGGKGSRPRPAPTMYYIWQFPPFFVICWICYIIIFFYLFFLCINIIYRSASNIYTTGNIDIKMWFAKEWEEVI